MSMTTAPMGLRDPRNIGAAISRAETDISPPLTLVPHETKRILQSQAFAQFAAEDSTVDRRDRLAFEAHQHSSP